MRRGLLLGAFALIAVPAAAGAGPTVGARASPPTGPAPLSVVLAADGQAAAYHWDLGDGSSADGQTVQHTYGVGNWRATVTAQLADGGTATASVDVVSTGVLLQAPQTVRYGKRTVFRGSVLPAGSDVPVTVEGPRGLVAQGRTRADGAFALAGHVRFAGEYVARTSGAASQPARVSVVPRLQTRLLGGGTRGSRYSLAVSVRPAGAGSLAVTIVREGQTLVDRTWNGPVRVSLDTHRLTTYRIRVRLLPTEGYVAVAYSLVAYVVLPRLAFGAHGPAVAQLAGRLRVLRYAAPPTAAFESELLDAVYAFEKVEGLPRIGVVNAAFWRRLADPRIPVPRYARPFDHIEIDKPHQVLYVVRSSRVSQIVPVSTAGLPGRFTPVGRFSIYRKVTGFDPSPLGTLYDPMYFTGGYAIHGNPSVPPYPASHGCVRVPMWLAPHLYATNPYGETVYVY